jgi:hypothetical protein
MQHCQPEYRPTMAPVRLFGVVASLLLLVLAGPFPFVAAPAHGIRPASDPTGIVQAARIAGPSFQPIRANEDFRGRVTPHAIHLRHPIALCRRTLN